MPIDNTLKACPISRSEIIRLAETLTLDFRSLAGDRALLGIDRERVFEELIYPKYEVQLIDHLDLGRDEAGNRILGQFDPITNHLYFDQMLRADPRRVFTFWHEIGHVVLHGDWMRRLVRLGSKPCVISTTELSLSPRTRQQLEIQANLFASHAAAPTWLLVSSFERVFGIHRLDYVGPGEYSFCLKCGTQFRDVTGFAELCATAAYFLKPYFGGLSQEALGYRIQGSGLIRHKLTGPSSPKFNRVANLSSSSGNYASALL